MNNLTSYEILGEKPIGSGGNANVYLAKLKGTSREVALKELKTGGKFFVEKRNRFCIETEIVVKLQDSMEGIIPILDYGLPDSNNENKYWYTMPLAEPIAKKLTGKEDITDIVKCVIELAGVLIKLHSMNVVHRDIKPSNIYFYEGRYCLGDFGLVDYPEKDNLTKVGESVGAKATIAPEMKRNAKYSDGKKADVYSLAKTLWMLLTNNETGFDGTYDSMSKLMGLKNYYPKTHLVEINQLLLDSTKEEPDLRPSMLEFYERLKEWVEIFSDYKKSNLSQWSYIQNTLFQNIIPDSTSWRDRKDIIKILNLLGAMPSLNHMFTPTGGGMDLHHATEAGEDGCIALNAGGTYIVKPKRLIVENLEKDFIWSYFRLELEEMNPIGEKVSDDDYYEYFTEDVPGHYISWKCGNYGYYEDGKPLPSDYRLVERYLKGTFVFFSKASIYNDISGTYDARHDKMDASAFRVYIEKLRWLYSKLPYNKFLNITNKNPFKDYEKEEENANKRKSIIAARIEFDKFIEENHKNWNFTECFIEEKESNDDFLSYTIHYEHGQRSWFSPTPYISKDGLIVSDSSEDSEEEITDEMFQIVGIDNAVQFIRNCEDYIQKHCLKSNIVWQETESLFELKPHRIKPPAHLFTKQEIEKVLREGDDSKNNILVIDAKGYAQLVSEKDHYYMLQYPVLYESFCSYNNCVGKYSSLSTLEDDYISYLQIWLLHLTTGKRISMDYVYDNRDEKELIDSILKYY